jgi:hypothetical protein
LKTSGVSCLCWLTVPAPSHLKIVMDGVEVMVYGLVVGGKWSESGISPSADGWVTPAIVRSEKTRISRSNRRADIRQLWLNICAKVVICLPTILGKARPQYEASVFSRRQQ